MGASFPWTWLMYIFQFFFSLYPIRNKTESKDQSYRQPYTGVKMNPMSLLTIRPQVKWPKTKNIGRPHFIALSFAVLYRYYVCKLKVCGKLNIASLSVPFLQWDLLTLCLCFWYFSQHFKPSTNKKMMTCWRLRWWLASFSNKVFFKLRDEYYF